VSFSISPALLPVGSHSTTVRPSVIVDARSTRLCTWTVATVPCWLKAIAASAVMRALAVAALTTKTARLLCDSTRSLVQAHTGSIIIGLVYAKVIDHVMSVATMSRPDGQVKFPRGGQGGGGLRWP